jgi:transposase
MESTPLWIGIDVAKEQLDVAIGAEGETWSVANDEAGIETLLDSLRQRNCGLVVLEATGGFEVPAVSALAAAGIPVVVANPRQVRSFARATGQLAKTDRLDARILALFAERIRPEPRPLPDEAARLLDALITRRRQISSMIVAERNRLGFAPAPLKKSIEKHIRWLQRELDGVDADLRKPFRPAQSGALRKPCIGAFLVLDPLFPAPSSLTSRSRRSVTRRSQPSWGSPPLPATAGR